MAMQGVRSCLLMAVEKWQGEPTWGREPNQGQAHFCAHSGAAAFQCSCRRAPPRRHTQVTGMHGPLNKQASGMLTSMGHQHAHASARPKLRVSQNGAEDGGSITHERTDYAASAPLKHEYSRGAGAARCKGPYYTCLLKGLIRLVN
jgi:hypothetical protein